MTSPALATPAPASPSPDLAAIKQRQQATWSSGDYHMIATQIQIVSELLIEALDVHSTERVLDVATGSGNGALAAARRGCEVVGVISQRVRVRGGGGGTGALTVTLAVEQSRFFRPQAVTVALPAVVAVNTPAELMDPGPLTV